MFLGARIYVCVYHTVMFCTKLLQHPPIMCFWSFKHRLRLLPGSSAEGPRLVCLWQARLSHMGSDERWLVVKAVDRYAPNT